ncbi:MAG TPA: GNVR domain-containing protein, partial [Flavobacteriales bacterium]|nr:GNVR domain-containing protein [Flavobacteriales bacterium]
ESNVLMQLSETNNAQKVLEVNPLMENTSLNADVELLKSKFFIAKALQRLPLEVGYFFKGNILTNEYYTHSPFLVDDLVVLDEAVRGLQITVDMGEDGNGRLHYFLDGGEYSVGYTVGVPVATPHFRCVIRPRKGERVKPPEVDGTLYIIINHPKALVARFRGQLLAGIQDQNAKTVFITCRDNNQYLARDVAQAMADAFIEYDLERKSESAQSIVRFIQSQKDTVFAQLKDSEIRLQRFRKDNRVSDMEQLLPLMIERSNEYENRILELEIEDNLLDQIERSTNTDPDKMDVYELVPLLVGTSYEETLSSLIDKLEDLLNERREALMDVKPNNMAAQEIEKQINIQKKLIMASIGTLRKRLAGKRADYEGRIAEFEGRFVTLPEKQMAYSRIQRLFNINEKYYIDLLEKDIEYRISKAGYVPDNRVLEEAPLPTSPVSPNRNMVMVMYILTGLILGMLIVLVRYILHDNITSLNDIAKQSNASIGILGMVPKYKKEIPVSQLLIDKNPKSLIAESFRSVRTNLQFVDNSEGPKVIAITSTISGEGKTFVAINLAGIISFGGKRVIVLDLDMRKPKIHLGFGVENVKGMSTLLIGKDTIEDCVQRSTLKGLDFITAGPIPPNP